MLAPYSTSWNEDGYQGLFHKDEIDRGYQADEGCEVVPLQMLALEEQVGDDGKDHQRYHLLDHFELDERERASCALEADAVGGHLAAVFKESNTPREGDHAYQGPVLAHPSLLKS